MKKRIFILLVAISVVATSFAQTWGTRNLTGHIVRSVTTTNNTATQIDAITVASNETGFFNVTVWGQVSDTSGYVNGSINYRYQKTSAGTLTLALVDSSFTPGAGIGITGAVFAASAASNNIVIKVTGTTSKTIRWHSIIRQYYLKND